MLRAIRSAIHAAVELEKNTAQVRTLMPPPPAEDIGQAGTRLARASVQAAREGRGSVRVSLRDLAMTLMYSSVPAPPWWRRLWGKVCS